MSYMYMEYTWYILGYTMYIHQTGYTCYILGYTMHIHQVYTGISMDIHGISYMVYTWYIVVYPWIFLAFWNQISRPARAAGLIQWAHACGWSRVFYSTRHHGNCARGKGCPQKAQPDCRQRSPLAAVMAAAAAVSQAAFRFPSLLPGNNLNLGEGWGRGCLQDRWPMCRRALTLACAENWENK